MASLLVQERLLGATLGMALGLSTLVYERRSFWNSTATLAQTVSGGTLVAHPSVQVPNPIFGREAREDLAHAWNRAIDKTLGFLIMDLCSRGW
ncbi:hypothetical protein O6H91_15G008500 [Diphasiastrum complanatum]|uniref:Uncharacterized protein n=1 Tax=Diphasiastrum complanatum TaxID=34168 RepID=A0ACC2BFM2_DIPCM|nr:hypothetical protein O6H91_15G008500 [Diphasiastrum complanatum]